MKDHFSMIRLFFIFILLLSFPPKGYGQILTYPFVAEVKSPKVNLRAGPNTNYEKLCQLDAKSEVLVLDKSYGWYKVKLPLSAKSYISDKYIRLINEYEGEIIGSRVNVRAAMDVNSTSLGQVVVGEKIDLVTKQKDWYQIVPLKNAYGWISEEFLIFKSNDIVAFEIIQKRLLENEALVLEKKVVPVPVTEPQGMAIYISGKLENLSTEDPLIKAKLTVGGIPLYYLKVPFEKITTFFNYQVKVEGQLDLTNSPQFPYPVLVISKIELVL